MDKVKVNNQVVCMRKHVKRAKLYAINKYTKQIKELQSKKGNDSQIEKNLRKIERLFEKVKILKKMVPDFVSKKALSKSQDWNVLLTEKSASLEDQCLALLANDNELQKSVEKFHTEQSHLVEKIPALILEWEVKSQTTKSPENKKASDIRKQKHNKIAKRKNNNFKNATFPNNVAVVKKLQGSNPKEVFKTSYRESEKMQSDVLNHENRFSNVQPEDESSGHSEDSDSGDEEFFSKTSSDKTETKKHDEKESTLKRFHDSGESKNEGLISKFSNGKQLDNREPICKEAQIDSLEEERKEGSLFKNIKANSLRNENLSFNSAPARELKNNTSHQPSLIERLHLIANTDSKKLNGKQNKSNLSNKNTKAISVLDLDKLKNSERIPILKTSSTDAQDAESHTVVPKKDSFFLNDDEEPESEEETTSNKRRFLSRKFSNSNKPDMTFNKNRFMDKPYKSRNFTAKGFGGNDRRFKKPIKENSKFDDRKKFADKSQSFKKFDTEKVNNPTGLKKDNKRNSYKDEFQSKKPSIEKPEKVHPSWEAKNKMKEAAKAGFKGKRIVFE